MKLVEALAAGDKVDVNDLAFLDAFPYVALPHAASNPGTGGTGSTANAAAGSASAAPSAGASSSGNGDSDTDADADNASGDSDSGLSTGAWILIALLAAGAGIAGGVLISRRPRTTV